MKTMIVGLLTLLASTFVLAEPSAQTITPAGHQASLRGPENFFSGAARIDPLYSATASIQASGAYVTFEPSARSAWHTHPNGQYLIVTAGVGRTQEWGQPVKEIKPGDVVWCPPGVKHWHGASPTTAMTHLTVTGHDEENKNVNWMEKVSDAQYQAFKEPREGL